MSIKDVVMTVGRKLSAEDISALNKKGLNLVAVLGGGKYRLRGSTSTKLGDLRKLAFVRGAKDFDDLNKLDAPLKKLATRKPPSRGAPVEPPLRVLCSLDGLEGTEKTVGALSKLGKLHQSSKRRAVLEISPSKLKKLAALPGVVTAELDLEYEAVNNVAMGLMTVAPLSGTLDLDGSNEVVGVADTGLDTGVNDATMLADFQGRIINIRATVNKAAFGVADGADLNNHGTHVSGSILGDGTNSNGNLQGVAPAAQLTMLSMGPNNTLSLSVPGDLTTDVFQDAYGDGARIHNNSWSAGGSAGAYNLRSEDVDEFMRDNPDMLAVFAAGNDGFDGAGSVAAPGTAKNCLTVGACESVRPLPAMITINPNNQDHDHNPATPPQPEPLQITDFNDAADDDEDIASFSGRGPTDDGRIAPDLVAPGTWILSSRSQVSTADVGPDGLRHDTNLNGFYADDADGVDTHAEAVGLGLPGAPIFGAWDQNTPAPPPGSGPACEDNYHYSSGTSMAAPLVSGSVALLRQYLRERRNHDNPSGALLKALMINGATVPAGASNDPDNDRGFGWVDMENTLTPEPTGKQAYSDDVDLAVATGEVRSFTVQRGDTVHPIRVTLAWSDRQGSGIQNELYLRVIEPGGTIHDGDTTAFPTVTNNVQRVHIDAAVPGTYTIEVHGLSVIFGIDAHLPAVRQDFALAVINGIGFSPNPVDVCQVIDKSGSMGTFGYIEPVKDRAQQFVSMMRINDRSGVAAFSSSASTVHDVVPLDGLTTIEGIQTAIDTLSSGGSTSMGAGLERGQALLDAGGMAGHPQAMVLLGDGHENSPPWVGGGATDSPPSWYVGTDTTEILPTLPAATKVYTVSLGVQSDEVLLQDIATLTTGEFHGIYSPADIGKLHEIYLHLQALTGGEEVIASGSDSVQGLNLGRAKSGASAEAGATAAGSAPRAGYPDMRKLIDLRPVAKETKLSKLKVTTRVHEIPVDETMSTLTLMVSWHDDAAPVKLSITSPSHKTYNTGSPMHFNLRGNSYQFFRIEDPEPGTWKLVVRSVAGTSLGKLQSHHYTWGAYGHTPIRLSVKLPGKLLGKRIIDIVPSLKGGKKIIRSSKVVGLARRPASVLPSLIKKHKVALGKIETKLSRKKDMSQADPDLLKLGMLDALRRKKQKGSVFKTTKQKLRFLKKKARKDILKAEVSGLYEIEVLATGKTRGGFTYQRKRRFNVRT